VKEILEKELSPRILKKEVIEFSQKLSA